MPEAAAQALALVCSVAGAAWLALAMPVHWQQACPRRLPPGRAGVLVLRGLGGAGLLGSLVLLLGADHASIAVLVWVMSVSFAALVVALVLAWRPWALAWLVGWLPSPRR